MNRKYRRKYLFEFAKEKTNYKNKFYNIVFHAEKDDIFRIIRTVSNNSSMKMRVEKILFPKTIHDMCSNRIVINTELDVDYLRSYCIRIFCEYKQYIESYIDMKNQYEKFLFSEQYAEALHVINNIEEKMGLSVWSISKRMYLYDKIYGLEKHKRYLSELQNNVNNNILLSTLFELESYFAESNTSYSAYKKRLESYNDILQENAIIRMYLDYRFNVERKFELEKIQIAFMFDSQLSIVDMYETFVLAEQIMFTEGIRNKEKLDTSDFRLCNLNLIETPERICDYNEEYYKLLELYTCGKYQEYIERCEQYLLKVPQDFQSIILLVKSYILLNKKMDIGKNLCKWLYDVYSLNGKEAEAIQGLLSYLKVVRFTSWEYKIMGFISRKTTMPQRKKMSFLSVINDVCISPNIVNNECFNGDVTEFLDSFANICPITQKLYLYKLGIGVFPTAILDENRSLFFKADKLIDASKNDEALDILTRISRTDNYFLERVLRRKIRIYEQKEDYLAEVECVTNAILQNNNLQKRIDLPEVLKHVNSHLSKDIKRSIQYVVFTYLCMPSDYNKQRIAYSNYMDYNRYKSIDDIVSNEEKNAVLIEFLSKVCIQHILKRDIILNPGGNKADELRVEILKVLIDIDEQNRKKYYAEIAAITKQKSIKDRIKQINQSRVYVDTDNIKKENESTLREDFNRYLAMKDLDEGLISYDIYSEDYISDLKKIVDEINEKIKTNVVYSQKMIILKGIITTITEEFLFNEKYGLNTFLSSRIRHGYCKKQLTTVFQEYNLLSKKKKNNSEEYLINEYWDGVLPKNARGSEEIKKYLSKFTLNIEKKVDDIKKNWLSIKYREENESILDYTLCVNQCLLIDMDNIIDFNTFYDEIIELLWKYTLGHFAALREKIQVELLAFFQDELTMLLEKIGKISDVNVKNEVKTICNNINLCKSKIGATTKEFANVFEKKDVSYLDFTMTDLIDTCLEIITKLNSSMSSVKLIRKIDDVALYKGENFPYFVDAVNILINNALEHSGIADLAELELTINIEKEQDEDVLTLLKEEFDKKKIRVESLDFLRLSISNTLSEDIDLQELQGKIAEIFDKTKDTETVKKYSQREGGTGLYKLYKTFQYNINTAYSILYSIENQTFTVTILFGVMNILA